MGATQNLWLEQQDANYERNRYYHQRAKLQRLIRVYSDKRFFVAKLKDELAALEADWKARKPKRKKT